MTWVCLCNDLAFQDAFPIEPRMNFGLPIQRSNHCVELQDQMIQLISFMLSFVSFRSFFFLSFFHDIFFFFHFIHSHCGRYSLRSRWTRFRTCFQAMDSNWICIETLWFIKGIIFSCVARLCELSRLSGQFSTKMAHQQETREHRATAIAFPQTGPKLWHTCTPIVHKQGQSYDTPAQ